MSDRYRMIPKFTVTSFVQIMAEIQDYNHRIMNIPHMWKTTKGEGVKVVVIDTGLPKHVDIHPCGSDSVIDGYLIDLNGHSSHCSGTIAGIAGNGMGIAGIAPDCEDYYIAALDQDGLGSTEGITKAIKIAVDKFGADIISMSLGIQAGVPRIKELEDACNYAASNNAIIFAAAGNEGGAVGQPAIFDSVIAVAAVNDKLEHANFSNAGPEIDFAAGGVNVYSTFLNNGYAKLSGTSMATPALAAVGALIRADAKRKLTLDEMKTKLRKVAFDIGPNGWDAQFGHGIPVFGRPEQPDATKPPTAPPGHKTGPDVNCCYWKMWENFIAEVSKHCNAETPLADAIKHGLSRLDVDTKVITQLLQAQK